MILAKIEEDAGNLNKSIDAYKLSYTYQDSIRPVGGINLS